MQQNFVSTKKIIVLAGGGTGGHIFPLVAIKNYMEEEYDFIWIGEKNSLEEIISNKNNIKFLAIKAGKIRRYFDWKNFLDIFKSIFGFFQAMFYLYHYNVDIVFSKGGYVSFPVSLAAKILLKKIYIHESDMVHGISNKLISKIANKVFYTFPNEYIDNKKHILSGQIINPELISNQDISLESNEKLNVVIIAGSQGSTYIFDIMLKIIPSLTDIDFTVILGEKNLHFKESFEKLINVKIYDFASQKQIASIFKTADIAITRAGATSLWELYYFGVHSIMIPLSSAAGDHQNANASFFADNFGFDMVSEGNTCELEIFRLLNNYKDLRKKGTNTKEALGALKIIEKNIS